MKFTAVLAFLAFAFVKPIRFQIHTNPSQYNHNRYQPPPPDRCPHNCPRDGNGNCVPCEK
ncbi:hypothetical protein Vi05172_g8964 [Venturia inaequalis]|nr:hypothetical protein Vi05172_g8964 [Venturia inaequalis]